MARTKEASQTCYQALHVHPAAPQDLITAAYWKLTGLLQSSRESDRAAEAGLYYLTRAYQILADHSSRQTYDQSLGLAIQPLPRIPLRRRSSWLPFARREPEAEADASIDYYEMLRLDPNAHPAVLSEAYSVMRNHYLQQVERGQARADLVYLLEEAYAVLSDPPRRQEYDASRTKKPHVEGPNRGSESEPAEYSMSIAGPHAEVKLDPSRAEPADEWSAAKAPVNGTTNTRRERVVASAEALAAEDGVPSGPPVTSQAVKVLATISGKALLKSSKASARVARAVSRGLRSMIEGSSRTPNGSAPPEDEEEAVLGRVFVTVASGSQVIDPAGLPVLARLMVSEGGAAGVSYDVCKVPLTLGEDDACDIKLTGLAPRQARLLYHGGQFVLHVLTDDPAPRLRGDPVSWALLRDGDSVEVGPYKVSLSVTP